MLVLARDPLRPGVDLGKFLRKHKALVVGFPALGIFHNLPSDLVHADARRPFVDAFQVVTLLPVHLD